MVFGRKLASCATILSCRWSRRCWSVLKSTYVRSIYRAFCILYKLVAFSPTALVYWLERNPDGRICHFASDMHIYVYSTCIPMKCKTKMYKKSTCMQALRVNFSEVLKFVSVLMKSVNAAICLHAFSPSAASCVELSWQRSWAVNNYALFITTG